MESSNTGSPEPHYDLNTIFATALKGQPPKASRRARRNYALGFKSAVAYPDQIEAACRKAERGLAESGRLWWAGMHRFGRTKLTRAALPGWPFLLLASRFRKGGPIKLRVVDCRMFVPLLLEQAEGVPFDPAWALSMIVSDDDYPARVVWQTTLEGVVA